MWARGAGGRLGSGGEQSSWTALCYLEARVPLAGLGPRTNPRTRIAAGLFCERLCWSSRYEGDVTERDKL